MLQLRRWTDQEGSASLEFITTGMILLLPLVYLVLAMAAIQGGALAVAGAARQAVRVYVQSSDEVVAASRAEQAIRFALADAGLGDMQPAVRLTCSPKPDACLTRLGTVTVDVAVTVPLPLVPQVLTIDAPAGITVAASASERVSRFWGAG